MLQLTFVLRWQGIEKLWLLDQYLIAAVANRYPKSD